MDQRISTRLLSRLAEDLTDTTEDNVQTLGGALGFTNKEVICYIKGDGTRTDNVLALTDMLKTWQSRTPPESKYDNLRSALVEANLEHLAEKHLSFKTRGTTIDREREQRELEQRELEQRELEQRELEAARVKLRAARRALRRAKETTMVGVGGVVVGALALSGGVVGAAVGVAGVAAVAAAVAAVRVGARVRDLAFASRAHIEEAVEDAVAARAHIVEDAVVAARAHIEDAVEALFVADARARAREQQLQKLGERHIPLEIRAQGEDGREAYQMAIQHGKREIYRARVMLVGQERVGKTSLKRSLTGERFNSHEISTHGIDTMNVCNLNLDVAKPADKTGTWTLINATEEGYEAAVIHAMKRNLKIAQKEEDPFKFTRRGQADVNLHGKTTDFSMGTTTKDEIPPHILKGVLSKDAFATEAESNSGKYLTMWDFSGQDIYYTTHQVFLSWRAMYLLTFDLSKDLDETVPQEYQDNVFMGDQGGSQAEFTRLEIMHFWMSSIYAFAACPSRDCPRDSSSKKGPSSASFDFEGITSKQDSAESSRHEEFLDENMVSPRIILVGTHRESLDGSKEDQAKKIGEIKNRIFDSLRGTKYENHVVQEMFAIENSVHNDEQVMHLRRKIEDIAQNERYWGEEIPLKWLKFEEQASIIAEERHPYKSFEEVGEMSHSIGIQEDLLPMLKFYHDLGKIIYFGGPNDDKSLLQDIVIFNPQWLIDIFKKVIGVTLLHSERKDYFTEARQRLDSVGVLEYRLIRHLWEASCSQNISLEDFIRFLINLMRRLDLVSDAHAYLPTSFQEPIGNASYVEENTCYYVPSKFTSRCTPNELNEVEARAAQTFYADFHGFLPAGLFHRYMCRMVRVWKERYGENVSLFYRQVIMPYKNVHVLIEMLPPTVAKVRLTVYCKQGSPGGDSAEIRSTLKNIVNEVVKIFDESFRDLCAEWAKRVEFTISEDETVCSRNVGPDGGTLTLPSFGVSLEIPPMAIEGRNVHVALCVSTNLNCTRFGKDDEIFPAFAVQCSPPGQVFQTPVTLMIPHCAVLKDAAATPIVLYTGRDQPSKGKHIQTFQRIDIENDKDDKIPKCKVFNDRVALHIDNFTWYKLAFLTRHTSGIHICCHPFLPKLEETVILRVYLYRNIQGQEESMCKQVAKDGYQSARIPELFLVKRSRRALKIDCLLEECVTSQHVEQVVSYEELHSLPYKTVDFTLDFSKSPSKDQRISLLVVHKEKKSTIQFMTKYHSGSSLAGECEESGSHASNVAHGVCTEKRRTLSEESTKSRPGSKVTQDQIYNLAENLPEGLYAKFCHKLAGYSFDKVENIRTEKKGNVEYALQIVLNKWVIESGGCREHLERALKRSGAGGLIPQIFGVPSK